MAVLVAVVRLEQIAWHSYTLIQHSAERRLVDITWSDRLTYGKAVPTAKGGLLRLVSLWSAPALRASGGTHAWAADGGPFFSSPMFQTGFHLAVGIAMAVAYAFVLGPRLPGRPVVKGAIYALAIWLLNALAILPATGEGVAGAAHLSMAGMLWFAAAHTLFFVVMAALYARFRARA